MCPHYFSVEAVQRREVLKTDLKEKNRGLRGENNFIYFIMPPCSVTLLLLYVRLALK